MAPLSPDDHARLFRPHLDGLRDLLAALGTDVATVGDRGPDGLTTLVFVASGLDDGDAARAADAFADIPARIGRPLDDDTDRLLDRDPPRR